ncbi:HNH endonuclease [Longimonas halophila]|uniref:HNH endonuclease n=1 Tax=Longimonas halophila TaxID=1469170 RepID=A0A2H3NLL0_9BACT|nr:HNH endonuclease [Longimonas halophila]PEN06960.1 HNH endonuclease [Longimonas halophila]
MSDIDLYVSKIQNLRRDKNRDRYPSATRYGAPHKPILLLSVLDLIEEGQLPKNHIRLTPDLHDLFRSYWEDVMSEERRPNIAMPFFHLTGDNFWHLIPAEESKPILEAGKRLRSIRALHDHTEGARLDDELFSLLQGSENRDVLRATLIESYFSKSARSAVLERGQINVRSFKYSKILLQQPHHSPSPQDDSDASEAFPDPVRDQGFRRAVVAAYNHRCAASGIRILTADNRTAIDAAHIVPWSISHNDSPRNGIALSKLCHWAFEQGLMTISTDYRIRLSSELSASYNSPGYLGTLDERPIHLPDDRGLHPDPEYLSWHTKKRFRS